jgi:hypothetical protein
MKYRETEEKNGSLESVLYRTGGESKDIKEAEILAQSHVEGQSLFQGNSLL